MKTIFTLVVLSACLTAFSQSKLEKQLKAIEDEGKRLYHLEMASWHGTDLFVARFTDKEKIGGYFSYTEGDTSRCIFFSRDTVAKVIGTLSFPHSFNLADARIDISERPFSVQEQEIHILRQAALKLVREDTFFHFYENTQPNIIPIISEGKKKVYVLTGTSETGVIIFGNDYLLEFNKKNNLAKKKRLHNNIIVSEYGKSITDEGGKIVGGIHNHLPETGALMTATDICILMEYQHLTGWQRYTVVSKKYLSIWDCEKKTLNAISTKAVEKIDKEEK